MPVKSGTQTPQERRFIEAYASTQNTKFAGQEAGYKHPAVQGNQALARPAVQAEIARIQAERITNEVLPLAVDVHIALLRNPKTPAGALVQAVKLAYDRALGAQGADGKEPHEMTGEELTRAIERLKGEASERARPVIEHEAPAPGVFS